MIGYPRYVVTALLVLEGSQLITQSVQAIKVPLSHPSPLRRSSLPALQPRTRASPKCGGYREIGHTINRYLVRQIVLVFIAFW